MASRWRRTSVDAGIILLEYPESLPRAARERAFFDAMQRVKTRALIDRISRPHDGTPGDKTPLSNQVSTLADVQSRLHPGETVLDFSVGNRHSFLAAITTDSLRIVELPGKGSSLEERVRLLRTVIASTDQALRARVRRSTPERGATQPRPRHSRWRDRSGGAIESHSRFVLMVTSRRFRSVC
jgi:hypothetical protein